MLFVLLFILTSSVVLYLPLYAAETTYQHPTHHLTLTSPPPIQKRNAPPPSTSYAQNSFKTAEQHYFKDSLNIQSISWEDVQAISYDESPEQLFNNFSYYANPYYLHLIRQKQGYEDFILNLHQRYTDDHDYRKFLRCIKGFYPYEFLKLIDSEHDRIKALQQEREQLRQATLQKKIAYAKRHCLQINNTNEYQIFIKHCEQDIKNAEVLDIQSSINRYKKRITAAQKALDNHTIYDYSAQLKSYPVWNDPDATAFNNCIGTALDQQLHEELCDTRLRMHELSFNKLTVEYKQLYAPIVYRCTAQAKQEKNISVAFGLSDFAADVVTIVSNGMRIIGKGLHNASEFAIGAAKGGFQGLVHTIPKILTPQHWVEFATSIPKLLLHSVLLLSNEHARFEGLEQALTTGNIDLYFKRCDEYEKLSAIRMQLLEQQLKKVASMSWQQLGRCGGYYGATIFLDCVGLHIFKLATSSTGRKLMHDVAAALQPSKVPQTMNAVAGIGKVATENGIEVAYKVTELIKANPKLSVQEVDSIVQAVQELKNIENSGLKSIGKNIWQSPGGLIYKPDKKFGNRIQHVLSHANPNSEKNIHSVFSVSENKILGLIDEAWAKRARPLPTDPSAYEVEMGRVIGTKGETAIRLVVIPGTSDVITAYPINIS